ncbi:MAG: hypothetical protein JXR12_06430 [Neptunomonas phycophila]|uniref:hypothetical protein n=1 Tax=Neptunomonas phycophila TaxID=1572645 RepID=UPI003B8BDA9C
MATFQLRSKTIGAKRFDGDNAQEIADFLSTGSTHKYTPDDIETVAYEGLWAVKDGGKVYWLGDEELRRDYMLTVQGESESVSDDYR